MRSKEKDCSNCKYQMTGWDGGFFGLPMTCECSVYGETENRKNCTEYEKKLTKSDLLKKIHELEKENERLKFELKRICNLECENCKEEWCEKK